LNPLNTANLRFGKVTLYEFPSKISNQEVDRFEQYLIECRSFPREMLTCKVSPAIEPNEILAIDNDGSKDLDEFLHYDSACAEGYMDPEEHGTYCDELLFRAQQQGRVFKVKPVGARFLISANDKISGQNHLSASTTPINANARVSMTDEMIERGKRCPVIPREARDYFHALDIVETIQSEISRLKKALKKLKKKSKTHAPLRVELKASLKAEKAKLKDIFG
jgi:hypothetical protein